MSTLRDNEHCYVCGKKNLAGLGIEFEIDETAKMIHATFIPTSMHQGFEGIIHGGILSSLLDEAMAKLAFTVGLPAVTAEITIKFKASAAPGQLLLITGSLKHESRRLILAESKITRGLVVIAEASGKLLRM